MDNAWSLFDEEPEMAVAWQLEIYQLSWSLNSYGGDS